MKRGFVTSVLATVLLVGAMACSGETTPPAGHKEIIDIALRRLDDRTWSVEYVMAAPVEALNFGPPAGALRTSAWALPAAFELVEAHGEERVQRADGEAFTAVTVEASIFNEMVPKNYVSFNDFSDGAVSVFTGHLIPGATRGDSTSSLVARFDFVPRDGEAIVHAGRRHDRVEDFETDQRVAPFVYFGAGKPVETDTLIAVFDPGLPDWMGDELANRLPEIFDHYSRVMDRTLDTRPTILVANHVDPGFSGHSMKGGTRLGQIQIRLISAGLDPSDTGLLANMTKFLAHEGAHLWQEPVLADDEDAWIHEGGADALALAAIDRLGAWDEDRLTTERARARESCGAGLDGFTLQEAAGRGRFDLYYSCGLVIAQATEAELRKSDPDAGIETFWRALYEAAMVDDTPYDLALYLETLRALGGSSETADALATFVQTAHDDAPAALERLIRLSDRYPRPLHPR